MSDNFAPYSVELAVRLDDTYEAILKLNIRRYQDKEKLRHYKMERRTNGAKNVRHSEGALTQTEWRKAAPFAPCNGANEFSLGLSKAPLGPKRSTPEDQKVKLELELSELREWISESAKRLAGYDATLAPVWEREGYVKDAIRRTHGASHGRMIVYRSSGSENRKPWFEELLGIALQWGSVKSERRDLGQRLRAHERRADQIRRELERMTKKERRHG